MGSDFDNLLKKNNSLQKEIELLNEEIKRLRMQLRIGIEIDRPIGEYQTVEIENIQKTPETTLQFESGSPNVDNQSTSTEKVILFMSLFRGRNDVFARRWENFKKGTTGYSPACSNEWLNGICVKPKGSCNDCKNKAYVALDEKIVENHLRGQSNLVVGIYPLLLNETCNFLAIDFDDEGWQKDISTLRGICSSFNIPVAIERSRSGNGAHAWFFFDHPLTASLSRKFGSALLTFSMNQRHEITFKSYDRLFPNQDTMPKGGFGNLIALPLQKAARANGNSLFIDDNYQPYSDQWAFLSSITKLSENEIILLISKLCEGNELGTLKSDEEDIQKPWETTKVELLKNDFPNTTTIVKANMLFIPKEGFSQRALNQLKRLAAFKNPDFFKAQVMRLSTFNKPRIISCSEETNEYLCLPRGCESEIFDFSQKFNFAIEWSDKTNQGKPINVTFKGSLRDDQPLAVKRMLEYDSGVLCGTTAFGKTVAAIRLIAERRVNTLILVNRISLVKQWKDRIAEFLMIDETLPKEKTNDRSIIGQYGGGKQELNGIIDVAVMQSLSRGGEVNNCVKEYGMVIVDECHHVSAFSFELILKNVNAKYVYGLTATPSRKDGHHPIITMQCGPIRFRDDAKLQAEKRPFDHYVIPRFTSLRVPQWWEKEGKELSITDLYSEISENETRNQQIIDDVVNCCENGRNCIILTERTAHVELLAKELGRQIPDVISVMGKMGAKETRETMANITNAPNDKPMTIVATGRYIGEGFDEPRLDTLFLAMPISWKGTLQQYVGRLHRLFEGKKEALIYDYVDIHVPMLEKMYNRRLSGYASIGYKAKGESFANESVNIIFDKNNFLPVYSNDIVNANREILIVSPFITRKRALLMLQNLNVAIAKQVKVIIVTKPVGEYKEKDSTRWHEIVEIFKLAGITIITKPNIHQKFAIIDQRIVWYGSINLLSFGASEESMMRLVSGNIAFELKNSINQ